MLFQLIRHGVIGNTAAFGAVILGSSPSGGARLSRLFSDNVQVLPTDL